MIKPRAWILRTGHGTSVVQVKPACEVDLWEPLTTVADVLAALREPSEAMKLAGSLAIQEHYSADGGFCGLRAAQEQMTLTWNAMLDQFEKDQNV